jgi:bifunctional NMN adenylyltransferase/nudix hydrolase
MKQQANNDTWELAVWIGRFQPLHQGHMEVLNSVLKQAQRLLILCGSSNQSCSERNPWSFVERRQMFQDCIDGDVADRISIQPLDDFLYQHQRWVTSVQETVMAFFQEQAQGEYYTDKIALVCVEESDQQYLKSFPQWGSLNAEFSDSLCSTELCQALFANASCESVPETVLKAVPTALLPFLEHWRSQPIYQNLCEEFQFVQAFKRSWEAAPYPPVFVTVDALLVCAGHILLIERERRPGKGLLALPGGFLDQEEYIFEGCLRELEEETCIQLSEDQLRAAFKGSQVMDAPFRSARGRTVTHVCYFELPFIGELPKVEAADDAAQAFWLPLAELNPVHMFEDHYFIIQSLISI